MERTLHRQRPPILIEISADFLAQLGDSAAGLFEFLIKFGYQGYLIKWNGLDRLKAWNDGLPPQFNALFTTGKLPSALAVRESFGWRHKIAAERA